MVSDKNPENIKLDLLPTFSEVKFDRVTHKFDSYIDPKLKGPNGKPIKRHLYKDECECKASVRPIYCK